MRQGQMAGERMWAGGPDEDERLAHLDGSDDEDDRLGDVQDEDSLRKDSSNVNDSPSGSDAGGA